MQENTNPHHLFPRRLRAARELRALSQQELADRAHLQQATVSLYENGVRRPSLDNLHRIAEALDVTSDYLLGRTLEPEPDPGRRDPILSDLRLLSSSERRFARRLIARLARRSRS
jgi:transcriptional regulator with XRE-family HTH domain